MPINDDMTPEQIAQIEAYGNALLSQPDMTNIRHPLQAFATMFNALSGRQHVSLAERQRASARRRRAENIVVPRAQNSNNITTGSITSTAASATPTNAPSGFGTTEIRNPDGVLLRSIKSGRSGASFTVADEYADRFQKLIDRLEESGYDILPDQSSGYNYRNIRGTNRPSQHASGRAIDINSKLNARGRRGNLDRDLVKNLAAELGFRWGGNFPFPDDMHFEIDPNWQSPVASAENNDGRMNLGGALTGAINEASLGVGRGQPIADESWEFAGQTPSASPAPIEPSQNNIDLPAAPGGVEIAPVTSQTPPQNIQTAQATPPQNIQTAQVPPGNRPTNRLPVGVPPRIPPDLNIQRIERMLSIGSSLSAQELETLQTQYSQLIQPKGVEVAGGTAFYDPFSGNFMYFAPKLLTAPLGIGEISTQEQMISGPGGISNIPRIGANTPPSTGAPQPGAASGITPQLGAASGITPQPGAAVTPQNTTGLISPNLPPYVQSILNTPSPSMSLSLPEFPQGGGPQNIPNLAEFSTQYNSQKSAINKTAEAATTQLNAVRDRASKAGGALQSLNTIVGATRNAPELLRGQGIGDWAVKMSQWLSNIGVNVRGAGEGEIIQKLNSQLASLAVQDITSRGTNFQLDTLMRNFPSLGQTFQGSLALLDYLIQEQKHYQELGQIANQLTPQQAVRWNEIETAFTNNNPTYLNIPDPQTGKPATRVYTGQITSIQDALAKVKDGEKFITPDGRIAGMTAELRRRFSQGRQ